jgi:hypothetical protein
MGRMTFVTVRVLCVGGVATALLLTGCTDATDDSGSDPAAPIRSVTSEDPTANRPGTPDAGGATTSASVEDRPELTLSGCQPAVFEDRPPIGAGLQQIPNDQGSRQYATGESIIGPENIPVAYVVATGDVPEHIADRFCVEVSYLDKINGPRRSTSGNLYAEDTLNLDAATVTTVGDVNGAVQRNSLPSPLPEQHEPVW